MNILWRGQHIFYIYPPTILGGPSPPPVPTILRYVVSVYYANVVSVYYANVVSVYYAAVEALIFFAAMSNGNTRLEHDRCNNTNKPDIKRDLLCG